MRPTQQEADDQRRGGQSRPRPASETWCLARGPRTIGFWAEWAALVGLVALVIVFAGRNPTFL